MDAYFSKDAHGWSFLVGRSFLVERSSTLMALMDTHGRSLDAHGR